MTQDKTLREQLKGFAGKTIGLGVCDEIANFYEDKIKSVVREMRKEPKFIAEDPELFVHWKEVGEIDGYNQFGDDLLERLGIK